ncbi:MAG: sulfotransferase domain-containing protein [Roseobacter sp.]
MSQHPKRTKDYIGPVTDTRIWDRFDLRTGDVVLSTPPKCGTTWTQAILMMLLAGKASEGKPVWQNSLWLDCGFRNQEAAKTKLEETPGRRCIKSHTPFDGIPYRHDVTYITVYRHPIDVHFSLEKHVANMKSDTLDFLFPGTVDAAFDRFLTAPATDAGTDDLTLASVLHHYRSFNAWSHLPNVHFFHYSSLKQDIRTQILRFSDALGIAATPDLIEGIATASSFRSMRKVAEQSEHRNNHPVFKKGEQFFESATSNKWETRLSPAQLSAYERAFSAMAQGSEKKWLETATL